MSRLNWVAVVAALQLTSGIAHAQVPLPPPWYAQDIGDVGVPGSASRDSISEESTWRIAGAGSDIWGTSDSFFFAYQYVGDAAILATPNWPENTNPHAKSGLMIRQSTDPASAFVIIDFQPDGSIEFMTRPSTGAQTQFIAGRPPGSRGFFGLSRKGGTVTAAWCFDTCETLGSVPFPEGVALMGLAVTSHDDSVLTHATFVGEPNLTKLPSPPFWTQGDVQNALLGHFGDAYSLGDQFVVTGYGADIWGSGDAYHQITAPFLGDGYVSARVAEEDAVNTFAKAGVIITENFDQTVILDVRPNGLIEFMARPVKGGSMTFIAGSSASFPVWLKLQRTGTQFTGLISEDGLTWQTVGSTAVDMPPAAMAGMAVTSHDTSQPNVSTFDHVVLASHWYTDIDVGDVGAGGCWCGASSNSGLVQYFQDGSGADIWGTRDAFNFYYRRLLDDQRVIGRLFAITAKAGVTIDPFAKAGIMIRASLDPSAAHVILDVRPTGDIEFMVRPSSGAETSFIAGSTAALPIMLRLTRVQGSTVVGETSSDGVNWNTVGTASVDLGSDPLVGTVVTSHERGSLLEGQFEQNATF